MKKIVIVEDDSYVSRMYERAFRLHGYDVVVYPDGEAALRELRIATPLPDAIIMDVMMPKMSGIDLLRNIKQEQYLKNLPVVVLTNSFLKENADQFMALGADLYLVKIEHSSKDVVAKIDELIEKKAKK